MSWRNRWKQLSVSLPQCKLEAWFTFLAIDDIEIIIQLIEKHPEFRVMYEDVYNICQNVERVMKMFSKELQKLDRNTVQYMIDDMQDTIDAQQNTIQDQQSTIQDQQNTIQNQEEKFKQGIQNAVSIMREVNLPESEILEKLQSKYELTEEQAREYLL